ncbi:hypothetical protein BMS3Bbin03_02502 [bacterium BMS3Bbin03]|nr:hypothetical protein BMS3Bbin03_02502 [bacterium BMS3Bbin03]HDL78499.1 hypothetical protein [Bacteroidota bacterium]
MLNRLRRMTIVGGIIFLLIGVVLISGCERKTPGKMTVLIQGSDAYARWLQTKITKFSKSFDWQVTVSTYVQNEDLLDMLNLEQETQSKKIGVIEVPLELSQQLVRHKKVIPFSRAASEERLARDLRTYNPAMFPLTQKVQKVSLMPERADVFLMVYLKVPVKNLLKEWKLYEREFSFVLQRYNHWGLPIGYSFEKDPSKWDFYDLAFMGYYWAAKPYHDALIPRLGHQGLPTTGTLNALATRVIESGGTNKDLQNPLSRPVVDMFQWESLFVKENYYNPEMWENGWSSANLVNEFLNRRLFLTFLNQQQLFSLFEKIDSNKTKIPVRTEDVGISILPRGCSLMLGPERVPETAGSNSSSLYVWSLGIPSTFPDAPFAYKLIRFMTSRNLQAEAMNKFGILPTRKGVLAEADSVLDQSWKRNVFHVLRKQLNAGVIMLPSDSEWTHLGALYLAAWENICVKSKLSRQNAIKKALKPIFKDVMKSRGGTGQ